MSFIPSFTQTFFSRTGQEPQTSLPTLLEMGIENNHSKMAYLSYISGELINSALPNGELPLHFAIRQRSLKTIEKLLNHPEIDLVKKDDQGLTALDHLFLIDDQEFHTSVLSLYLKKTIDHVDQSSNNLSNEQTKGVRTWINQNANEFFKMSSLQREIVHNDSNNVKMIIEHKADVNELTVGGMTALHLAALNNQTEMMEMLINAGADLNIPDHSGFTALHYAVFSKGEDFTSARYLIENGANPLVESNEGITPLALMTNIARSRSSERDPLKQNLLQSLLCVCSVASWIHSYYGNQNDLMAAVLQTATSSLFSCMTIEHLLKAHHSSHDLKSFLSTGVNLALPVLFNAADHIPYLGELSLAFRTFNVGQGAFQGLKAGLRNRSLDPLRSMKIVMVSLTNASFALWNIQQRVQSILKNNLNNNLNTAVDAFLDKKDCTIARMKAAEIDQQPLGDQALLKVVKHCAESENAGTAIFQMKDPSTKEKALQVIFEHALSKNLTDSAYKTASKMSPLARDAAIMTLQNYHLEHGRCQEAYDTANKLQFSVFQEKAFESIAKNSNCVANHSEITFRAIMKLGDFSKRNSALLTRIDNFLVLGKCTEAFELLTLLNGDLAADNARGAIATDPNCLKDHLEIASAALVSITSSHKRETAQEKVFNFYLENKMFEEAFLLPENFSSRITSDIFFKALLNEPAINDFPDLKLRAALKLSTQYEQNDALALLVTEKLDKDQCEDALAVSHAMHFGYTKDIALKTVLSHSCLEGRLDVKLALINGLSCQSTRDELLTNLINDHLANGQLQESFIVIQVMTSVYQRDSALQMIINTAEQNTMHSDVSLQAALKISNKAKQIDLMTQLFDKRIKNKQYKEAFEVAKAGNHEQWFTQLAANLDLLKNHPDIASKVELKINPLIRDSIVKARAAGFVELKQYREAFEQMSNFISKDVQLEALKDIAMNENCIKDDPELAYRAVMEVPFKRDFATRATIAFSKAGHFIYAIKMIRNSKFHPGYRDILIHQTITNNPECMEKRPDLVFQELKEASFNQVDDAREFAAYRLKTGDCKLLFDDLAKFPENLHRQLFGQIAEDANCAQKYPELTFSAASQASKGPLSDLPEIIVQNHLSTAQCKEALKAATLGWDENKRDELYEVIAKNSECAIKAPETTLQAAARMKKNGIGMMESMVKDFPERTINAVARITDNLWSIIPTVVKTLLDDGRCKDALKVAILEKENIGLNHLLRTVALDPSCSQHQTNVVSQALSGMTYAERENSMAFLKKYRVESLLPQK